MSNADDPLRNHDTTCTCGMRIGEATTNALIALRHTIAPGIVGVVLVQSADDAASHMLIVPLGQTSERDAAGIVGRAWRVLDGLHTKGKPGLDS
jgi:hypothetical protein